MKRRVLLLLLLVLIIITGSIDTNATELVLKINNPKMVIDNDEMDIEYWENTAPVIVNGRSMLPIRPVIEVLGGVVRWDDEDRKVTIEYNDRKIEMWLNVKLMKVDGEDRYFDVPPMSISGRTMVPLRFVSESLGFEISWDGKNKKISIKTNQNDFAKYQGEISFWHYNAEEAVGIVKAFNNRYPNVKVNLSVNPLKDMVYQNKLTSAIKAGSGVPDVFPSEASFVKKFVDDEEIYTDLSDISNDILVNMVPYTVDIGTDYTGRLKVLTNQLSVGAFLYKKSVAEKYLGTSDSNKIADMLSSEDNMLETAKKLKVKSKGKVALFSSWEDLKKMYLGGRSEGWVIDGKLTIDQNVLNFIDFSKKIKENKYEAGYSEGTSSVNAAIAGDENFLATVCPSSDIYWVINKNDKKAFEGGRWGIAKPPIPFGCGGTWYGISNNSEVKDLSWRFLKFLTIDTYAMKEWAVKYENLPNNLYLLSQGIPNNRTVDVNMHEFFGPLIKDVNYRIYTKYDDNINNNFNQYINAYLDGKISSKEEFFKQFKSDVQILYPEIVVE
ncbi:MAG TPA: extracellular solute-binding protein [Pseudobacteroides sp.]|uniref:extracellular solute-binding protein n=1 Tax=Pseudobacteroides sp. TaxID=1968840 RepID=UPI002F94476E